MIFLVLAGITLTAAGIIGDARSWWNAFPFFTNLLSGAAGAAFGIPVAIVIVRSLLANQDSQAQRKRAELSIKTGCDLLLEELRPTQEVEEATLGQALSQSRSIAQNVIDDIVDPHISGDIEEQGELGRLLEDYVGRFEQLDQLLSNILPAAAELIETWSAVVGQWHYLSTEVRARATEAGIAWLPLREHSRISRALAPTEHPLYRIVLLSETMLDPLTAALLFARGALSDPHHRATNMRQIETWARTILSVETQDGIEESFSDYCDLRRAVALISAYRHRLQQSSA